MQHSTRFGCVFALFLLLPAHGTKAQAPQTDESAIAMANELAKTYSKIVSALAERFFGSLLPSQKQPDDAARLMQALSGRLQETYVDVATPIFARRLAAQDMRVLTEEFKAPVFHVFTTALAEGAALMVPCMWSKLDALPKPPEPPGEEQRRLARQLWALQQEANTLPPQTGGGAANPPKPERLQKEFARFEAEWRQRSSCMDDGATAMLATRLTAEHLKSLIAVEQSAPMQKLNAVTEEVHEQLGLKLAAEFWDNFLPR